MEEETSPAIRDTVAAIFPDIHDLSDDADDEETLLSVSPPPLQCEHLFWKCHLSTPTGLTPTTALIDSGAHIVLIRTSLVQRLNLTTIPLATPQLVNVAISPDQTAHALTHYVVITPAMPDRSFTSKPVHAIVVENLCAPIILGLPFLVTNQITCNYARRECNVIVNKKTVNLLEQHHAPKQTTDYLAAISQQARMPAPDHELLELETELRKQFQDVFEPLPHANELPDKPVTRIRLKDPDHTIRTRNYACPRKWKDALMRRRRGSTRGYAHSEDLETGVRRSGATDRQADGATTRALQPPLRLIPSFRRPHAFSARSDRPETWQERRAQVIRRAHSELERVVARIALNNTKTTLVVFKSLTARADISELYKQLPRVGLVLVRRPCHVGGRPTSRVVLQGPGAGARGTECADRSPGAEVF